MLSSKLTLVYLTAIFLFSFLYFSAIDLYFINNTPELMGGSVSAEFTANRPGLKIFCQLTHLDKTQDCKFVDGGTHMICIRLNLLSALK